MADDPIDRLYGLPLEEFVPARDALAKALRAEGDRERAAEVKRLAKPTRAAWAVNQLARSHADEVRALVDAGAALAGAQEELLGGADPAVLRQAAEAARALVDALAARAPVDGATRDKVRATLHAATVDADVRAEVASGRVLKERAASGFGGLDALVSAAASGTAKGKGAGAKGKGSGAKGEGAGAKAPAGEPPGPDPREVRRRRDALRRANEAEAEAESAVDGARRSLEQVEATVAARRRDLEEAEAALAEARDRRERAERAAAELS